MSPIKSSASNYYALLAASILLDGEIISLYSRCAKKGLVYIIIIFPFNCQLFSYLECTKANTRLLYNMRSVPFNKYIYSYRRVRCCVYCNLLMP